MDSMQIKALQSIMKSKNERIPNIKNARKKNKEMPEDLEDIKADGFTELDLETEKCTQILRSY